MKYKKRKKRLESRRKDYDKNLSGEKGFKRPGSLNK